MAADTPDDLRAYLSGIVDRVLARPADLEALAAEEAARTDPWRWCCRLCGAEGEAGREDERDAGAAMHLETTPCGRHATTGTSRHGRLLHVWTYPPSASAQMN